MVWPPTITVVLAVEAHHVQGGLGFRPHGEHVAERVGGGDLAVDEGVVHHRGDEVHGLDHGHVVRDFVDSGVLIPFESDDQVLVERLQTAGGFTQRARV